MDIRITIQTSTESVGANGYRTPTWSNVITLWAEKVYGGGAEGYEAERLTANNEVTFRTRYYPSITEKMRVLEEHTYYDILHIAVEGRQKFLVLKCKTRD